MWPQPGHRRDTGSESVSQVGGPALPLAAHKVDVPLRLFRRLHLLLRGTQARAQVLPLILTEPHRALPTTFLLSAVAGTQDACAQQVVTVSRPLQVDLETIENGQ